MFRLLINAKPSEVGFTPSTQTGENIVLEGLDAMAGGNVVTNDLHYGGTDETIANEKNKVWTCASWRIRTT